MKLPRTAILVAVVVAAAVGAPALVAAQEPVTSFAQLDTRLKPGDTVWITDAEGREIEGRIQALAPDRITLEGGDAMVFAAHERRGRVVRILTAWLETRSQVMEVADVQVLRRRALRRVVRGVRSPGRSLVAV